MNFISYAPNFEDIVLWRALRQVEAGCYLDVGAADPVHGSVTQAFYQRGWHGINLEPAPALHARLAAARPADLNLAIGVAASSTASAAAQPFFDVPDSQRSSFTLAQAQACRSAGLAVLQREAQLTTLAEICRQHVTEPVHFLNLAINGEEAAALSGMDWQQCRPWIVLVRCGEQAAQITELMQAAHYQLAYYDGQKQYFVAAEQAQLAQLLALPPHADDQFTLYEGHHYAHPLDDWRQRTEQAERSASEAHAWVAAHERSWTERASHAETRLAQALKDLQNTETTLNRALQATTTRAELAEANAAQAHASAAHESANGRRVEAELAAIYASRAWRLSKPIRGMVKLAQLLRSQLRHAVWRAKHVLAQGLRHSKAALLLPLKTLLKASLRFITARPALAFFLRRQIARFPRLVGLLRTLAIRLKAPAPGADPAGVITTELEHLPASARHVYRDLQRALQRTRHPSAPQ